MPAVIRDVEIDVIKRFLHDHSNVQLERTKVNVNDMVRVISGPLMEQEGRVLSVKNKTVKISLPSLGYIMAAEVETANIALIDSIDVLQESVFVEMKYKKYKSS
jgi:transcription antitermination factor NusG